MQKWVLERSFNKYFNTHAGFRARVSVGRFKDTIWLAQMESKVKEEFTDDEISFAIKHGIIAKNQINLSGTHVNIIVYLGKECLYQPTWYKRWFLKLREYFNYEKN